MARKILIVGGVGGGATVAAQLRRYDKEAEIILFDKGDHISFSNCGIPYYIGNVVQDRDDILFSKETFSERYDVNVKANTEVTAINRSEKQITCKTASGTYEENYDTLILSPGASPILPDIKGINNDRTFRVHTIPDMDAVYSYIKNYSPETATITGAGFVGLEMLENLHRLGMKCTLINRSDQVFKPVDSDLGDHIQKHLKEKDVTTFLNEEVKEFTADGQTLHLNSGTTLQSDLNIMAVGIRPNISLAVDAGLTIGATGTIKVNEYMQTSDPDIYALGDAVETKDSVTGTPVNVALAPPAHRQAYVIARYLNQQSVPYRGTLGTSIIKLFDLTIGATGHNSNSLKEQNISFKETELGGASRAGYYPGSEKVWLKVLFDEESGQIYGGQAVGFDRVDKRLAVLATAIHGRMTVNDLEELELGYAPPYSGAKDLVNVLGYKAASKLGD